jgi:molecular chaperone GrpE
MNEPNVAPEPNASARSSANGPERDEGEALRKAEQERDQYLDLLQRTKAEFDNYQKRSQRDRQEERRYSASPLALELLPVLDNLERALTAAAQAGEKSPLVQGVSMVHGQMLDALKRHGITRTEALHKPFDPNLHQAVMQQPDATVPPNTVIQVLQSGYAIHDRVLRPASVIVAAQES